MSAYMVVVRLVPGSDCPYHVYKDEDVMDREKRPVFSSKIFQDCLEWINEHSAE